MSHCSAEHVLGKLQISMPPLLCRTSSSGAQRVVVLFVLLCLVEAHSFLQRWLKVTNVFYKFGGAHACVHFLYNLASKSTLGLTYYLQLPLWLNMEIKVELLSIRLTRIIKSSYLQVHLEEDLIIIDHLVTNSRPWIMCHIGGVDQCSEWYPGRLLVDISVVILVEMSLECQSTKWHFTVNWA